jgi:hypothetical protein
MKRLLSNKLSMPDGALFQQVDSMKGKMQGKKRSRNISICAMADTTSTIASHFSLMY